jgi:N-acetylmuramoyl-L-alanine amidase CwlA
MLKISALALASVSYALAAMTAIPTNGIAYIMQDGRTTRCVTLGAAPTSDYAKIGMEFCTGSTAQQVCSIFRL